MLDIRRRRRGRHRNDVHFTERVRHLRAPIPMGYGGAATVRAQLRHILEMSELDHVTVRVIPFGKGSFPGTGQSVDYLVGPVPQLDTVQLDTHHGCEFLDAEAQLEKYRQVLDRMEANALKPDESRDLIHRIAQST